MKNKPGKMYAQILGAGTWKIGKITTQDNEGLEIVKLVVYFAISGHDTGEISVPI